MTLRSRQLLLLVQQVVADTKKLGVSYVQALEDAIFTASCPAGTGTPLGHARPASRIRSVPSHTAATSLGNVRIPRM